MISIPKPGGGGAGRGGLTMFNVVLNKVTQP